jgi:hypothetical protein
VHENWQDHAQVCLNGHIVNPNVEDTPQDNRTFCGRCGAATILACPSCDAPLDGTYYGGFTIIPSHPENFCHGCGRPYPWTEAALKAARELADELDDLSPEERETLKKSLDDIVADTPRTQLAVNRVKGLLGKAGQEAAGTFKGIVVSIVTEAAKKMLWP